MARQLGERSGSSRGAGEGGKGAAPGEVPSLPKSVARPPTRGWAQRHAGTLYIFAAFGAIVLIAVLRVVCN